MTDDELLLKSLRNFQEAEKEERRELTGEDEVSSFLAEDLDETIELLDDILPKIKNIDSLFEDLDEDEFSFIVDCLEDYAECFIVDGRDEKLKEENEAEYSQLMDIMFDFYDDDEENEEDEED